MRILRAVISSAVLLAMILSAFVTFSSSVSAREYEGSSPSFAVDTWWSLYVDHCDPGDIIWWYWESDDSLGFRLLNTPDMIPIYGFSSWDGYVVQDPGWYNLGWYNNNLFFSATVFYSVEVFRPSLTITTPSDGSYSKSFGVDVQGKYDGYADGVLVGLDALHLYKATTVGTDWGFDGLGLNEGLNTVLVRSYYWLDPYGTENYTIDRTVQVTVDITIPELVIVKPRISDYVAGTVDMSWRCSDNTGIAKREVKVDVADWVAVTTDTYTTQVEDGAHTIKVQVTDLAGNSIFTEVHVISDTVAPQVTIAGPSTNAKISKDRVVVSWSGNDDLSGIDHYEVQISGWQWIEVGPEASSYEFTGLDDVWYSVNVKAVDKSGNTATSTVGFGIYTSVWSQNGPYQGIPLFALIAGIVAIIALSLLLWYRKGKSSPQEPVSEDAPKTE